LNFELSGEMRSAFREKLFDAGDVKLNVAEGPDNGPTLVLLHGLGRNWRDFAPIIPALAEDNHIFAIDLRGHGHSSHVANSYRLDQYSHDVAEYLLQHLKTPSAVFGHSLGGSVAMWIAANHPSLVTAIIVGDSALSAEHFEHSSYPVLFASLHDIAVQGGAVEVVAGKLANIEIKLPGLPESLRIGDFPGNDDAYLQAWARGLKQVDPDVFTAAFDGSFLRDVDPDMMLRKIQCPTMLLQANPELDGLMSNAEVKRSLSLLADGSHTYFPALGHALHRHQAEPVLRAVRKFLDGIRRKTEMKTTVKDN
jgi:pimeloyl-ACP methyl ester carboxylesterase